MIALGRPGAIVNDSNTSPLFLGSQHTYVAIPDDRRLSLTQAWDNFNRGGSPCTLGSTWGTSAGGDAWSAQVTSGNNLCTDGNLAEIVPYGTRGTWQQGINLSQLDGDMQVRASWSAHAAGGPLQPVALVARRIDNSNFVKAELQESATGQLTLYIVKYSGGTSTVLGSVNVGTYALGAYWYVRFQFHGSTLQAKAWPMDMYHFSDPPNCKKADGTYDCKISYEPGYWQVTATDSSPAAGGVAIRSANSMGTARPNIMFESFWVQTLGFSIHAFWRPSMVTFSTWDGARADGTAQVLGKGTTNGTSDHQLEYEMRFMSSDAATDPGKFKVYMLNSDGDLGAGTNFPGEGEPPIAANQWYDIVAEFDSGGPTPGHGDVYSGLNPDYPLTDAEWQIVPASGTNPLRFGTQDTSSFFTGQLDEIAIWDHKLSADDIAKIYSDAIRQDTICYACGIGL